MAIPLIINSYPAVIASGASLSGPVATGADTLSGLWMPAAWTAASITFLVSPDGGTTWVSLFDDAGNEVAVSSPAASRFIVLSSHSSSCWRGINLVMVRSGTSAAPVNQGASATVTLIARPEIF